MWEGPEPQEGAPNSSAIPGSECPLVLVNAHQQAGVAQLFSSSFVVNWWAKLQRLRAQTTKNFQGIFIKSGRIGENSRLLSVRFRLEKLLISSEEILVRDRPHAASRICPQTLAGVISSQSLVHITKAQRSLTLPTTSGRAAKPLTQVW